MSDKVSEITDKEIRGWVDLDCQTQLPNLAPQAILELAKRRLLMAKGVQINDLRDPPSSPDLLRPKVFRQQPPRSPLWFVVTPRGLQSIVRLRTSLVGEPKSPQLTRVVEEINEAQEVFRGMRSIENCLRESRNLGSHISQSLAGCPYAVLGIARVASPFPHQID
jgi:hypothetical protein